jgi:hypothetical protein
MQLQKFVPLVKIDESTHTVWGLVTAEVPDKTGEICDYEATKKSYQSWSREALEKTTAAGQDPSLGNIRLMHQLEIAGKATKIEYRDDMKQIWLATTPANDQVWKMIKGGFITGYSQGGDYLWKKQQGRHTRYAATINEVSYVDNPCLGDATFAYVKADGSTELRKFVTRTEHPIATMLRTGLDLFKATPKAIHKAGTPAFKGVIMPDLEKTGAIEHLQKAKEAFVANHATALEQLEKCITLVGEAEQMNKSAAKAAEDTEAAKAKMADDKCDADKAKKADADGDGNEDDDKKKKKSEKTADGALAKAQQDQFAGVLKGMQDQFAAFMTKLGESLEAPKAVSGAGRLVTKAQDNGAKADDKQTSGAPVFKAQQAASGLNASEDFEKAMKAAFASGTPIGASL